MVAAQSLQVLTPDDSLARLRVVTYSVGRVDIVPCILIARCRSRPVTLQCRADLFVFHGFLPFTGSFPFCSCQRACRDDARDAMTCGGHILEKSANPGMPV